VAFSQLSVKDDMSEYDSLICGAGCRKELKVPLTINDTQRIIKTIVIGKELRQIRKQLGLTQAEFADLVGVAPNSIARQERGEIGIREPLARLIRLLAEQRTSKPKRKKGEESNGDRKDRGDPR